MKFTQLVMVLLLAALSFGGSFTCSGSSHGDPDDDNPPVSDN